MFAIVRTGGKQYRVAPGDKIVVEKLSGEAGDNVELADVLLAGDGGDLKSTSGLTVAARIVAQAKADKVTVFKKKRRHNYRRKRGHRQQHTILEIVSIGGKKADKPAAAKAETKAEKPTEAKAEKPAKKDAAPAKAEKPAAKAEKPPAKAEKPAAKAKSSTKDAAPAKPAQSKAEGAAAKKAAPKAAAKKK